MPTLRHGRWCEKSREQHPAIAHMFGSGAGLNLMRRDSDMTESIQLRLRAKRYGKVTDPRQLHRPEPLHR